MKYKDSYRHMKNGRDKYGNVKQDPNNWYEVRRKAENKARRSFVQKMYDIDKHWVKTLSDEEMKTLYRSWSCNQEIRSADDGGNQWLSNGDEGDGSHKSLEDFVKFKKPNYGSVKEARDLKIEELFQD